jgi:hypothetical protein
MNYSLIHAWMHQSVDATLVCRANEIGRKIFCRAIDRLISTKLRDAVVLGIMEDDPFRWYKTIISMRNSVATDSTGDKLLDLLIHIRELDAANPRDKVFSTLGLMKGKSEELGIVPDYESSEDDVFKNTAVSIIEKFVEPGYSRCCSYE